MSVEDMDIDSSPTSGQPAANPASPEKKRKHTDKDHKSSKRRKHEDELQTTDTVAVDGEKKKKKKQKGEDREHRDRSRTPHTPDPSSQLLQDGASERASQKKHKKHKDAGDYSTPPSAQRPPRGEGDKPSIERQSPTLSRKPLANTTTAQSSQSDSAASPFQLITSTLYLPLSPISISPTHALSSLLVEHVSPLLLTYYPPLQGIILAYSNPSISSNPPSASDSSKPQDSNPQPLTLATTANEYGVLYVYLTATFLVFRPERNQTLEGWINVQSEGFLGAVVFNLFSVGIEKSRLPAGWKWIPPGQTENANGDQMDTSSESGYPTTANTTEAEESDSDKENHFKPLPSSTSVNFADPEAAEEDEVSSGYFQTPSGKRVRGTIRFRVKDVDVIPGSERDKGFLNIEGTMLSEEEEARLVEAEKKRFEGSGGKGARNQGRPRNGTTSISMSGGLTPGRGR
ncbi:hypothetical protein FQN54_005493 [Arachnomyces sp. PD_36]|nr:hypothetical protein FQN54_005493 [Arachnomyces sp. PD_36]